MKTLCFALAAVAAHLLTHAAVAGEPRAVVEAAYEAFAQGDMDRFVDLMAADIVWHEAEGSPYADRNPYEGPEAVMSGLFSRLAAEWESITVAPHEYVVDADRVVVFGRYDEVYEATGEHLDIPFVHSWTVKGEKLVAFQQYTDTAALVATMTADVVAALEQAYEQVAVVPAYRSLVRPEDGVMLADGTLLVADQLHGLVAVGPEGTKPFGDFKAAGYVHDPPARSAGPNGVALEPDGVHVLVADVLTGAIYRVHTGNERVTRIHQHAFGVNSVRRDRSGAVWFTQSTKNSGPDSEARMFAAVDMQPLDGALFRLAPTSDHEPTRELERKDSGMNFANGLAIDEDRGYLYVAETIANRIIGYQISVRSGQLSNRRVVAEVPTPDNIELDAAGRLWVASPVANALLVVEPESGEWTTAFNPRTEAHDRLMVEWRRRTESGEPRLELFGPDMWSPMPGLVTGMILTSEDGPIYLTGLGDALVQLARPK